MRLQKGTGHTSQYSMGTWEFIAQEQAGDQWMEIAKRKYQG